MLPNPPRDCPCGSGLRFNACCGPLHKGTREADTAEALMRSRYAAFVVHDAGYLVRTLSTAHPDHALAAGELERSLRKGFRTMNFTGLTILDRSEDQVLFIARAFEKGRDHSFIELSDFRRENGALRYVSGVLRELAEVPDAEAMTIARFAALNRAG